MNWLLQQVRDVVRPERLPWLAVGVACLSVAATALSEPWIYDRAAVQKGELWRLWTGNFAHHGWVHWFFDVGLFMILGRLLEWRERRTFCLAIVGLGLLATGAVYVCEPSMLRYAGLSGVNAGLLVYGALQGWQRRWTDWFWPAILLLYVAELVEERTFGRGMVQFNDPGVRVATVAHLGGIAGGLLLWLKRRRSVRAPGPRAAVESKKGGGSEEADPARHLALNTRSR